MYKVYYKRSHIEDDINKLIENSENIIVGGTIYPNSIGTMDDILNNLCDINFHWKRFEIAFEQDENAFYHLDISVNMAFNPTVDKNVTMYVYKTKRVFEREFLDEEFYINVFTLKDSRTIPMGDIGYDIIDCYLKDELKIMKNKYLLRFIIDYIDMFQHQR